MEQVTFNPKSLRVRKAKIRRFFLGWRQYIWISLFSAAGLGGGWLLFHEVIFGNLLIGIGIVILMLWLWFRLDLKELALPVSVTDVKPPLVMEALFSAEILVIAASAKNPKEIWQKLSKSWQWQFLNARLNLSSSSIGENLSERASDLDRLWSVAFGIAYKNQLPQVSAGVITLALLRTLPNLDKYLAQIKLSQPDLDSALLWQYRLEIMMHKIQQKPITGGLARDWAFGYTPLLNRFGENISRVVEKGGVVHLHQQIHGELLGELSEALATPGSQGVALTGDVGVGKSSIVYALAEKLMIGAVPPQIAFHQVVGLNPSVLISSAPDRGQLEGLVMNLFSEASRAKNIMIFLDDAELFFSDQTGSVNLANILLPVLESGRIRLIIAISNSGWQKLTSANPSLATLFNRVTVPEPSPEISLKIMQDHAFTIEAKHKVTFTYQAVAHAFDIATRYIREQAFPGKGVGLLASAARYGQRGLVTIASIDKAIEVSTGVKVAEATIPEKTQLLKLEEQLHKHMINQDHAVKVVADALRRARAGVADTKRPVGSFLFLGPTGVGKTQLARALARIYFASASNLIRLDMSEYATSADVSRLLAPPTDIGSSFLTQIRSRPASLVLLDEIEKAHPDILNLLLALLEEGELTDTAGRKVSFRDSIVISTSNAGADTIRQRIEAGSNLAQFSQEFIDDLINRKRFLPELINRFDEVVLFRPLTVPELKQIVEMMIGDVNQTLEQQKINVNLTSAAIDWLVANGNDPRLGARPLRRLIQRSVENIVAQRVLKGAARPGSTIAIDVADLQGA